MSLSEGTRQLRQLTEGSIDLGACMVLSAQRYRTMKATGRK